MNEVNFSQIKKNITGRETEIRTIRQQLSPLISVNSDLRVVIEPAEEAEAREIMDKINALKTQNERDSMFSDRAKALLREHNIPLKVGSRFPEGQADLGTLIENLHRDINYKTESLKNRFLTNEITSAVYEAECEAIRKPLEERIREIEAVSAELDKLAAATGVIS